MESCNFEFLYSGEEGYVVKCIQCNHYQVAFGTTMLTLDEEAYAVFYRQIKYRALEFYSPEAYHSKCVIIATPDQHVHLILTPIELNRLYYMMGQADNESKALGMLQLFNHAY